MRMLDLGGNKFGNDGVIHLAKCVHNVEGLGLYDCNIEAEGMKLLSQAITKRKQPVIVICL